MPIYEYLCVSCGERTERLRPMSDSESVECPSCKAEARKVISASNFRLKGTGWYETDFKNNS